MSSHQVTHCQLCGTYQFGPHEARFTVHHEGRKKAVCPPCKAKFCEYCSATLRMFELENKRTGNALTVCNGCMQFMCSDDPGWQVKRNVHTEA